MFDKATGRVVAVIVLLIVIAASLRGYLPGAERAARKSAPDSGSSLVYVIAMLSVSVIILAVAIIVRLRDPRRAAPTAAPLPQRFSGGQGRPAWQVLVIGAAVLVVWLLTVWLLSQFIAVHTASSVPNAPPSSAPAPGNNAPPPPATPRDMGGDRVMLRYLIATAVALLVLAVTGAVVAARRRRATAALIVAAEPTPPPVMPIGTSESLVRAAEVGLAEIGDRSREPREAIIACYAAMERELAHVPGAAPQDFDTPTEVLARAVENQALHIDNASELVNLFEEARFSPHVMSEAHRESALRVLQLVLAELRSPV